MGSSRRNLNWIGRTASWLAACLLGGKTGPTLAARQPAAEAPSRVSLGQAVVRLADQSGLRVVACIPAEMETCTVTWSRLEGWMDTAQSVADQAGAVWTATRDVLIFSPLLVEANERGKTITAFQRFWHSLTEEQRSGLLARRTLPLNVLDDATQAALRTGWPEADALLRRQGPRVPESLCLALCCDLAFVGYCFPSEGLSEYGQFFPVAEHVVAAQTGSATTGKEEEPLRDHALPPFTLQDQGDLLPDDQLLRTSSPSPAWAEGKWMAADELFRCLGEGINIEIHVSRPLQALRFAVAGTRTASAGDLLGDALRASNCRVRRVDDLYFVVPTDPDTLPSAPFLYRSFEGLRWIAHNQQPLLRNTDLAALRCPFRAAEDWSRFRAYRGIDLTDEQREYVCQTLASQSGSGKCAKGLLKTPADMRVRLATLHNLDILEARTTADGMRVIRVTTLPIGRSQWQNAPDTGQPGAVTGPAWAVLADSVASERADVRAACAEAIGETRNRHWQTVVSSLLGDPDPGVAEAAATSGFSLGLVDCLEPHLTRLARQARGDAVGRAEVAGATQAKEQTATLRADLSSPSPALRAAAARVLGALGDRVDTMRLETMAKRDSEVSARIAAAGAWLRLSMSVEAAEWLNREYAKADIAGKQAVLQTVSEALDGVVARPMRPCEPLLYDLLQSAFKGGSPELAAPAAIGLGRMGMPSLVPQLSRGLQSPDAILRVRSAAAILRLARDRSRDYLSWMTESAYTAYGFALAYREQTHRQPAFLDVEHVLLGLLSVPDCAARDCLRSAGLEVESLRSMLTTEIQRPEYQAEMEEVRQDEDAKEEFAHGVWLLSYRWASAQSTALARARKGGRRVTTLDFLLAIADEEHKRSGHLLAGAGLTYARLAAVADRTTGNEESPKPWGPPEP